MIPSRTVLAFGLSLSIAAVRLDAQTRHFERDASRPPADFLPPSPDYANSIACADLDGDGRLDVVHAGAPSGGHGYYVRVALRRGGAWSETALPVVLLPFFAPVAIELIDLDRDGDMDLIVRASSIYTGAVIDYFRNDGRGAFARVRTTSVPSRSGVTMATGDVDGDGDPDLVVGLLDPSGAIGEPLVLARHDGSFGFRAEVGTNTPVPAYAPVLLDLDGDGDLDLLAVDAQRRVIRFDNQNGAFAGGQPVGPPTLQMRTGDLDGDGDLDVVLQETDGRFATLTNTGGVLTRTALAVSRQVTAGPFELADVDGDGDPDLLLTGFPSRSLEVWRNDGSGGFATSELLPAANALGRGDFDGDGTVDLVVAAHAGRTSTLIHGGAGPLGARMDTAARRGPRALAPGILGTPVLLDVDRDGMLDVVESFDGVLAVRRNLGGMAFDVSLATMPSTATNVVVVGDVDADGDGDLVVSEWTAVRVVRNDGAGVFTAGPPVVTPGMFVVAAYDLDGDGDDDVVAVDNDRAFVLASNGTSSLGAPVVLPASPAPGRIRTVARCDVDRDGDPDLVVGGAGGCMQVLRNAGTGAFTATSCAFTVPFVNAVTSLLAADVDGDGDEDLLIASFDRLQLFVNDGAGNFTSSPGLSVAGGLPMDRLHAADLDEDGDLDVVTSGTNHSGIWINDGAGGFTQESPARLGVEGLRAALAVGDLDGDGDVDFLRSDEPVLFDNVRALATLDAPFPGGTLRFAAAQDAGFAAAAAFVLPVVALQPRPSPLVVPGIAGLLQVDLASGGVLGGVLLPPGSGRAEFGFGVPASPIFVGVDVVAQGLVLGVGRAGWTPMVRERVLWR